MNDRMKEIAKEIIDIKVEANITISGLLNIFYSIMRKYNIKQGTALLNEEGEHIGTNQSNSDWIMCESLFLNRIKDNIELEIGFGFTKGFEVPIDIRY